jgi:hypothetical protein
LIFSLQDVKWKTTVKMNDSSLSAFQRKIAKELSLAQSFNAFLSNVRRKDSIVLAFAVWYSTFKMSSEKRWRKWMIQV